MSAKAPPRYPLVTASEVIFVSHSPQKMIVRTYNLDIYEEVAYRRIVDQILMSADRLEDDDKKLGHATKLGKAKWLKVKASLIEAGLLRIEDGRITSSECQEQLARVELQISQKSRAGKASAEARYSSAKSLKNNEMESTAVTTGVPTAVGTNYESSIDDNNNAREKPVLVAVHAAEQPPPVVEIWTSTSNDPNAAALIQGLTDAVNEAFGSEIGEMTRPWAMPTDTYTADEFLNAGKALGVDAGEVIDTLRKHFSLQCRKLADKQKSPPRTLSMFHASGMDELRKISEAKTRASKPFAVGSSYSHKSFNSGEAATRTAVRQPWQDAVTRLAGKKLFGEMRQISDCATKRGDAAANMLAASLEEQHFGKKPIAAQAA